MIELVSDDLDRSENPNTPQPPLMGISTPRIHTPLNDLPSRGQELIDLAASIGVELMDWQKFYLIHSHKVKPDGRWATPINVCVVARQNGKSFLQQIRILGGLFLWKEPLQIASAHTLATSLEQFRSLVSLIESNDVLAKQVKRIRWAHGAEEIETLHGTRFIVKAGGSSARGVSRPETVHLDELLAMLEDAAAEKSPPAVLGPPPIVVVLMLKLPFTKTVPLTIEPRVRDVPVIVPPVPSRMT